MCLCYPLEEHIPVTLKLAFNLVLAPKCTSALIKCPLGKFDFFYCNNTGCLLETDSQSQPMDNNKESCNKFLFNLAFEHHKHWNTSSFTFKCCHIKMFSTILYHLHIIYHICNIICTDWSWLQLYHTHTIRRHRCIAVLYCKEDNLSRSTEVVCA